MAYRQETESSGRWGGFKLETSFEWGTARICTGAYLVFILEWTTSLDTSSRTLFVCPGGTVSRLYRHIRQAAIPVLGTGFIAHL